MTTIGRKTGNTSKGRPKHFAETGGKTKVVISENKAKTGMGSHQFGRWGEQEGATATCPAALQP